MSERGVIGIARGIWDDPDFADEPFTEREAFMWLVSEAAWKERRVRGPNGPLQLQRGEVCHSIRFMATAWQWSKSRVGRFLERLKKRDMVRDTERDGSKVYFISNYNKYQIVGLPERDTERDEDWDTSGTAAGQQRDSSGTNEKNLNIEKSISRPKSNGHHPPSQEPEGFSEFWNIYPRKVAKRGAEKAYSQALARASPGQILAGAKRYARAAAGRPAAERQFIAHATTWLNQDRWADEDGRSPNGESDEMRRLKLL